MFIGKQEVFNFKCPYNSCSFKSAELGRHLKMKHGWAPEKARLETIILIKRTDDFQHLNVNS